MLNAGRLPVDRGLRISPEDKLRREAITRIMCDLELDKAAFGCEWGIDFDAHFADALLDLEEMQADGLVQLGATIRVTETGRVFLRNIAMAVDSYLHAPAAERQPRYSRTL